MRFLSFTDVLKAVAMVALGLLPAIFAERISETPKGILLLFLGLVVFIVAFIQMINKWAAHEHIYKFFIERPLLVQGVEMLVATGAQTDELIEALQKGEQIREQKAEQAEQLQKQNEELWQQIENLQQQNADLEKQMALEQKQNEDLLKQMQSAHAYALKQAEAKEIDLNGKLQALRIKYAALETGDVESQYSYHRSAIARLNASRPRESAI